MQRGNPAGGAGGAGGLGDVSGWQQIGSGLGSVLGGIFTNPGDAYRNAQKAYGPWMDKAAGAINPYAQAGERAIPGYEQWLSGMQNPSGFINQLMSGYQESPYAQNLQDQAMRSGMNAASASGTLGSTPFANEMQQQAGAISSQDMQNWLANVLGINSQYGQGLGGLMGQGLGAAGSLANIFSRRGEMEGGLAYGKEAGRQQKWGDIFGGLGNVGVGAGRVFGGIG